MKIPSNIAKRYEFSTGRDAEPGLNWYVSRERASLVAWLVVSLYTREKQTPLGVLQAALKDVDFTPEFLRDAASLKAPFLSLDTEEKRYFAFLCQTIRESVGDDCWTGEGRQERWTGAQLTAVNAEIEELVARLRVLVAQRDALSA